MPNGWITVRQAMEQTGYGRPWIVRLIQQGRLKARKVGPIWTIHAKALDAFMALDRPAHRPKGSGKRRRRKTSP